jgi:hypothetical protein
VYRNPDAAGHPYRTITRRDAEGAFQAATARLSFSQHMVNQFLCLNALSQPHETNTGSSMANPGILTVSVVAILA